VARVLAFVPDLLFGSRVLEALRAEGHEVELVGDLDRSVEAQVVIVDLTADAEKRIESVRALRAGPRVLAFYSHVETDVLDSAQRAGFDLVVPRSRMAREGAQLVTRLASEK
jgi:DNA-binding NarL/FixJ family response regulator